MHTNRLCHQRDVQRLRRIHREKLKHMKSTCKSHSKCHMDNTAPTRYKHLELRLKKAQMDEDLQKKIQHENCLLISKMYTIMKSERPTDAVEYQPGVRLSKDHQPVVDCFLSGKYATKPATGNIETRRRDFNRVMQENVAILKRIQNRKPTYSVGAWEEDRSQTERHLSNLSKTGWHLNGHLNAADKAPQRPRTERSRRTQKKQHREPYNQLNPAYPPVPAPPGIQSNNNSSSGSSSARAAPSKNNYVNKGRVLVDQSSSASPSNQNKQSRNAAASASSGIGVLLHVAVVTATNTESMPKLMRQFAGMVEASLRTKAYGDSGMVHYHSLDDSRFLYISLGTSVQMVAMQKAITVHARASAMSALGMTKSWQGKVFGAVSGSLQSMFDRENGGKKIRVDVNPAPSVGYPPVISDGTFVFEDGANETDLLLHVGVATVKTQYSMNATLDAFHDISTRAKQHGQPVHQYHVIDESTVLYICVTDSATALAVEKQVQQQDCIANFSLYGAQGQGSGTERMPLVSWSGKIFGPATSEFEAAVKEGNAALGTYEVPDPVASDIIQDVSIKVDDFNPAPVVGFGSTFGNSIESALRRGK